MKYDVVKAESICEITSEVNKLIKEGWEPQGGICIRTSTVGFNYFYQAMIKREE